MKLFLKRTLCVFSTLYLWCIVFWFLLAVIHEAFYENKIHEDILALFTDIDLIKLSILPIMLLPVVFYLVIIGVVLFVAYGFMVEVLIEKLWRKSID